MMKKIYNGYFLEGECYDSCSVMNDIDMGVEDVEELYEAYLERQREMKNYKIDLSDF